MNNKVLNILLWIAQVILGAMFLMAGAMKASQPIEALAESLAWATTVPLTLIRFIGISELVGGIGLLLPSLLRIQPQLTVWAAIGLIIVMLLAAIFHATRGEYSIIGVNIVLMAIGAFIAWGRHKKLPIEGRG